MFNCFLDDAFQQWDKAFLTQSETHVFLSMSHCRQYTGITKSLHSKKALELCLQVGFLDTRKWYCWMIWLIVPALGKRLYDPLPDLFVCASDFFLILSFMFHVIYCRRSQVFIQIILTYLWTQRMGFLYLPLWSKQTMSQRSRTSFLLTNLPRKTKKR